MRVIAQSPDPLARMHTITDRKGKSGTIDVKALLAGDRSSSGRWCGRAPGGARSGDDAGAGGREERADTARAAGAARSRGPVLDRTVRALPTLGAGVGCRTGRDVRAGVSTRKVKSITEELCGHNFSASSISAINQRLDASLAQFAGRALAEALPYLILDARHERVREAGVIASHAVLIAIGIDWDGRRQVLAAELANRAQSLMKLKHSLECPTAK